MKLESTLPISTVIDHLAIAVRSIEAALPVYLALGGVAGDREVIRDQGVTVITISFIGSRIELLEPLDDQSTVARFIARRGEGLHHIALQVDDIMQSLGKAEAIGLKSLDKEPRRGAEGKLIAFLDPRTTGGVLIELTQVI